MVNSFLEFISGNVIISIILAVIFLIMLFRIIYFIMRLFKGRINIILHNDTITWGQKIIGSVEIIAKSKVDAQSAVVAIVGERKNRTYSGRRGSSGWNEFYRTETKLSGPKLLESGSRTNFNFIAFAPNTDGKLNSKSGNPFIDSFVGGMLSLMGGKIRWSVQVRIESTGVDLFAKKIIHIYEPSSLSSS